MTSAIRHVVGGLIAALLLAGPVLAQSSEGTWNNIPDRFQVDAGYFLVNVHNQFRFNGGERIDFERDLGLDDTASTFWIDGTWRLGRRHQLKLSFTSLSRDRGGFTLQRQFTWGGDVYEAGLTTNAETGADILGGYYRFAIVRKDRFEIGPAIGIGYLWVNARIKATGTVNGQSRTLDRDASTGSITGALGGYASAWATKRLLLQADFLYIKVKPEDSEASITDWRVAADYYFLRSVGLGLQYKYDRYSYDRGIVSTKLGGEITYKGVQALLSFRF